MPSDSFTPAVTAPVTYKEVKEALHDIGERYLVRDDDELWIFHLPRCWMNIEINPGILLSIIGWWARRADITYQPELLEAVVEVNTNKIGPKAIINVDDKGMVRVVAEQHLVIRDGVTPAQLRGFLQRSIFLFDHFANFLEERFPDYLLIPKEPPHVE